jgi:hypothetical protein
MTTAKGWKAPQFHRAGASLQAETYLPCSPQDWVVRVPKGWKAPLNARGMRLLPPRFRGEIGASYRETQITEAHVSQSDEAAGRDRQKESDMRLFRFFLLIVLAFCGCTSESDFKRLMAQEGITNPKDEGTPFFGCSGSDSITHNRKFSGFKNGRPVRGVMCGAPLKGYTFRYE